MCADVRSAALGWVLAALAAPLASAQAAPDGGHDGSRTFEFTTSTTIQAGLAGHEGLDVWIPMPVSDGYQEVTLLSCALDDAAGQPASCAASHEIATDPRSGNEMLHVHVSAGDAPALHVTARYRVTRWPTSRDGRPDGSGVDDADARLKPDRLVPLDGPVAEIAAKVQGDKEPCALCRAIFEEVRARMTYDKTTPGWGHGDALRACEVGKGNCTDFHSLFMALARARGVPARFTIGHALPEGAADGGPLAGYHCWAEFWCAKHGWVPVDVSEADKAPQRAEEYFGRLTVNRIALSSGRDLVLAPPQQGQPVNFLVQPYVERGGVPLDQGVEHVVSARDL
jgi:transglutaminase-like putative cysteine protease